MLNQKYFKLIVSSQGPWRSHISWPMLLQEMPPDGAHTPRGQFDQREFRVSALQKHAMQKTSLKVKIA